jgi:hypothetical protein
LIIEVMKFCSNISRTDKREGGDGADARHTER